LATPGYTHEMIMTMTSGWGLQQSPTSPITNKKLSWCWQPARRV